MPVRPVDFQVAVPRLAEVDKVHKLHEQPGHTQLFANEVQRQIAERQHTIQQKGAANNAQVSQEDGQRQSHQQERRDHHPPHEKAKPVRDDKDDWRGKHLDVRV